MTTLSAQWGSRAVADRPWNRRTAVSVTAASATVLVAVAAWVLVVRQMSGMDMGPRTRLGSLPSFAGLWVPMMAAMMLPGCVPAVCRRVRDATGLRVVPAFVGLYLAVWALAGGLVFLLYRPHGHWTAGVATMAAGVYELTPLKARFRRRCHDGVPSGLRFGVDCLGSGAGLMLVFVSLGVMSVTWMVAVTVLVLLQKVMRARTAFDVPVALALVGLGALVLAMPTAVPGLGASM